MFYLTVIQFDDGRYGIANASTGIVLGEDMNSVYSYKNRRRAVRKMNKLANKFNRIVGNLK